MARRLTDAQERRVHDATHNPTSPLAPRPGETYWDWRLRVDVWPPEQALEPAPTYAQEAGLIARW